uniref:P-type ATPase A domain-containing protein n=1 Tax=Globisporangium ultimum (strain ATCC 200006 / CBS 805.95 / DAOM BR144) TaxID=431595 RepID=K3W617_GLOUD
MKSLQEHLVVPVDDYAGRRSQLVYAPNEHEKIVPYAYSAVRLALFWVLVVGTGGVFGIVSIWFPQLFTWVARSRLPYSVIGDADFMLVLIHRDGFRSQYIEQKVHRPTHNVAEDRTKLPWVWFEFKKHRYVYNHEKGEFERYLASICEDMTKIQARLNSGLDVNTASAKMELFGANLVDIKKPRIPMLLFTKIVHPFYLFQVFSATVWFLQQYTVYAIVILVMSASSLTWEIYSEVSNSNRLRSMVRSDRVVEVVRADRKLKIHETELVPGDVVVVVPGPMVADLLLLSGACVADEASLTGEALPVNKEPAMGAGVLTEVDARTHYKASFLHAGSIITRVREASDECRGIVLSTGFSTGKGELFRSIIFPKTITFEFERDSYRYLALLATIAFAAFLKRVIEGAKGGSTVGETIVNSLDLFTIAVPPALPIVLSSGIGFALNRLKQGGIFCIDSQRINSCGQLSCFCFDKTGTLTQEHLTLASVDVVDESSYKLQNVGLDIPATFKLAMATCHGLSEAEEGGLQGYSLDLAMFKASKYELEYLHGKSKGNYVAIATDTLSEGEGKRYGLVKRFSFDATCQTSSVIVEELDTKKRFVFVKGSPEAIKSISTNAPEDLHHKTISYSAEGYYCIGFGVKEIDAIVALDLNNRQAVESGIRFEGLAVFKNELKTESKGIIDELYVAEIDVRMITGDNALTAVHVARELEMKLKDKVAVVDLDEATGATVYLSVDSIATTDTMVWVPLNGGNFMQVKSEFSIAITGVALDKLHRDVGEGTMKQLLSETLIFARIRPQQKAWIVEELMELGHIVGMCGDGTNDCGALKAAHVGLALSSAEASIVAPFTSNSKAILDVPVLIREGRCALTTSFLGFKFM